MKWILVKQITLNHIDHCDFILLDKPNFRGNWAERYFGEGTDLKFWIKAYPVYDFLYPDGCPYSFNPNQSAFNIYAFSDEHKKARSRINYTKDYLKTIYKPEKYTIFTGEMAPPANNLKMIEDRTFIHDYNGCLLGVDLKRGKFVWERVPLIDVKQIFDGGCSQSFSGDFSPFVHCPVCGKKIEWNWVYKRLYGFTDGATVL